MVNEQTLDYIRQHREDDVRQLALRGAGVSGVDLPMAMQQIAGWQIACKKLPTWAAADGLFYPPHLNMEQCSSEQTARYKASLLPSPSTLHPSSSTFIDLTGGFGVDFYFMSQAFSQRVYVEQNAHLCALAEHNFACLSFPCSVHCSTSEAFLSDWETPADCIFLDPARRDDHGARTYALEDCSPNVLELLPLLRQKTRCVVLKLSPMLDWHKAVNDLGCVSEVHIVSVQNECKELLLLLRGVRSEERGEKGMLYCVNFLSDGRMQCFETSFDASSLSSPSALHLSPSTLSPLDSSFLYEPNASIMKAGCFDELAASYAVGKVSVNSHLFVSSEEVADFPGRGFRVEAVSSLNKRDLKEKLRGVTQANITVRNFPMSVAELRRRLGLKDGGEVYIFATTLSDGQHRLLICRKIG